MNENVYFELQQPPLRVARSATVEELTKKVRYVGRTFQKYIQKGVSRGGYPFSEVYIPSSVLSCKKGAKMGTIAPSVHTM